MFASGSVTAVNLLLNLCREEVAVAIQKQLHAKSLSPQQTPGPSQTQALTELFQGLAGACRHSSPVLLQQCPVLVQTLVMCAGRCLSYLCSRAQTKK